MNRDYIKFICVCGFAAFLISCSKGGSSGGDHTGGGGTGGGGSPVDTTYPGLTITTPADNQNYTSGASVNVSGRVTDDLGLYRGSVRITNDATGSLWKEQLYEIHYILSYNYSLNEVMTTPGDYTVTVRFEDHGYNAVSKSVKIKVNP